LPFERNIFYNLVHGASFNAHRISYTILHTSVSFLVVVSNVYQAKQSASGTSIIAYTRMGH